MLLLFFSFLSSHFVGLGGGGGRGQGSTAPCHRQLIDLVISVTLVKNLFMISNLRSRSESGGFGLSDLVEGAPAHGRKVRSKWSLKVSSNQNHYTYLWILSYIESSWTLEVSFCFVQVRFIKDLISLMKTSASKLPASSVTIFRLWAGLFLDSTLQS